MKGARDDNEEEGNMETDIEEVESENLDGKDGFDEEDIIVEGPHSFLPPFFQAFLIFGSASGDELHLLFTVNFLTLKVITVEPNSRRQLLEMQLSKEFFLHNLHDGYVARFNMLQVFHTDVGGRMQGVKKNKLSH
jgi:hypothetical protein